MDELNCTFPAAGHAGPLLLPGSYRPLLALSRPRDAKCSHRAMLPGHGYHRGARSGRPVWTLGRSDLPGRT
jgi:hypothetical protein